MQVCPLEPGEAANVAASARCGAPGVGIAVAVVAKRRARRRRRVAHAAARLDALSHTWAAVIAFNALVAVEAGFAHASALCCDGGASREVWRCGGSWWSVWVANFAGQLAVVSHAAFQFIGGAIPILIQHGA